MSANPGLDGRPLGIKSALESLEAARVGALMLGVWLSDHLVVVTAIKDIVI